MISDNDGADRPNISDDNRRKTLRAKEEYEHMNLFTGHWLPPSYIACRVRRRLASSFVGGTPRSVIEGSSDPDRQD